MTITTALTNQLERDIQRQKNIVRRDLKENFLHWNESRKVFLGLDHSNEEWIAGVDTHVPCYWVNCTNKVQKFFKGKLIIIPCNKPHFIPIFRDGDNVTCVECHETFVIHLELDPKSSQFELLQQIKQERSSEV